MSLSICLTVSLYMSDCESILDMNLSVFYVEQMVFSEVYSYPPPSYSIIITLAGNYRLNTFIYEGTFMYVCIFMIYICSNH